jgi:hypothetical protein
MQRKLQKEQKDMETRRRQTASFHMSDSGGAVTGSEADYSLANGSSPAGGSGARRASGSTGKAIG